MRVKFVHFQQFLDGGTSTTHLIQLLMVDESVIDLTMKVISYVLAETVS